MKQLFMRQFHIIDVIYLQAGQSGHRTLLYGHAVLLRHSHSNMVRGRLFIIHQTLQRSGEANTSLTAALPLELVTNVFWTHPLQLFAQTNKGVILNLNYAILSNIQRSIAYLCEVTPSFITRSNFRHRLVMNVPNTRSAYAKILNIFFK